MRKRRKVTFADSIAREVHCNEDVPSPTAQRDLPLIDKNVKTSEFKYFRKLQEEASNIHKTSAVPLHDNYTNRSKAKNKSEETYAMSTSKLQNSMCSTHEKPTTVAERFTSPAKTPENKEIKCRVEFKDDAIRSLAQNCEVTPLGQSLLPSRHYKETWNSDVKFQCEESFSRKRRKLLQLVAGSLPSEIYKHMSCRSDLIPFLLQRLGIRRMINSHEELQTSGEVLPERCTHNTFKSGTIYQPEDVKNMSHSLVPAIEHLPMNFKSPSWNVVDELKLPTLDYAAYPNFSNFEDELLRIKHSYWNFDEQEASEQGGARRSSFCLEWSNYEDSKNQCRDIDPTTSKVDCSFPGSLFACNATEQSVIPYAKSKFSEHMDLTSSLFPCNVTEQYLMPYAKSKFSELTDLPNSLFACNVAEQSLMPNAKSKFSVLTDLPNSLFACNVTEQSQPNAKSKFSELMDLPNSLFACNVTEQSLMPYEKSKFSEVTDLPNSLFACNVTEQSLVPYNKSKSSELMDLLNQVEDSVIPLTYSEVTEVEPEFPFASRNLVHRVTDDWPLSYFAFSSFMKLKDGLEGCDAFYSPLRNNYPMLSQDSTFPKLCPTPRRVIELGWKSLPAVSTDKCMLFSNTIAGQQLNRDMIQDGNHLLDSH